MSKDIVERMRFWSKTRNDNPTAWHLDCGYAADAIERLTAERDEARRSCCEFAAMVDSADTVLMYVDSNRFHEIAMRYMKSRGWDCYKEDGK